MSISPTKRRTLFLLMLSMFFGACMSVCISPFVLTTLLRDLGASVFQIALIPIIARASGFLTLPASVGLANCNHKRSAIALFLLARAFLIVPIALFLSPGKGDGATAAIVLLSFAAMSSLSQSSMGSTGAWFKTILPVGVQAGFSGKRTALSALVMGILMPLIGWLLAGERLGAGTNTYAMLFIAALILGYVDLFFLAATESMSNRPRMGRLAVLARVREALGDRHSWHAALVLPAANIGMMVVPGAFILLLFYDMGMSKTAVGSIAAAGLLAGAAGNVIGGRFADRGRAARLLAAAPLVTVVKNAALLAVSFLGLAHLLDGLALVLACGTLAALGTFAQGTAQAASVKLLYNNVRDGSSIGFGFIHFLRNAVVVGLMLASAQLAGWLQAETAFLQAHLWARFHYAQALLILSMPAGAVALIYLLRKDIYTHVGEDSLSVEHRDGQETQKAGSPSGLKGDWSVEPVPELVGAGHSERARRGK